MRQRPLEGIIAKLRVRCPHADDEDEPARPAGRMTVAQLRAALAERELPEDGRKAELLARLEAAPRAEYDWTCWLMKASYNCKDDPRRPAAHAWQRAAPVPGPWLPGAQSSHAFASCAAA